MSGDFWRMSALELLQGYARKEFSPVEVVDECMLRIERLNPALRAYLAVAREDAKRAARAAERTWVSKDRKPSLCGVPVSVKDTIEMGGMPTTYGSLAFRDNRQEDSEIVTRLRRAGAVVVGKTNTSEFALLAEVRNRLGEPGCNPWNLEHTCGGSSGGAAAAVAAGLGQLAVGTDSGGSIRLPAAYTGIFGLKPTYQRIPTVQQWRAAPGRSHNGPLARTVRDGALLLQALAGVDARDPDSALNPIDDYLDLDFPAADGARIAISRTFGGVAQPEPDEIALLDTVVTRLRDRGFQVIDDDPPFPSYRTELEAGVWGYSGDHYAAAESLMPGFWDRHADDLTEYSRPVYDAGRRARAWQYRRLLRRNEVYRTQVREWFGAHDFLLTPVTGPAPRHDDGFAAGQERRLPFLVPFNLSRNPAASITVGLHSNGLPLSVQVVGRLGDDLGVLRLAAVVEGMTAATDRWPALAENVTAAEP